MLEEIVSILATQLSLDPFDITIDSDIVNDLGADSLDIVELVSTFEKVFNLNVTDEEVMSTKTVQDILNYIEDREESVQ